MKLNEIDNPSIKNAFEQQNLHSLLQHHHPTSKKIKSSNINNLPKKIKLENAFDLYKLPISELKSSNFIDFHGKYFDEIYEEALKIERKGGIEKLIDLYNKNYIPKKKFEINKICFEMRFKTQVGQEIGIIGNISELGNWNQDKALKMKWSEGDNWRYEISFDNGSFENDFEYKFIFVQFGKVRKWEDGENRKFSFNLIKGLIENGLKDEEKVHLDMNQEILDYDINDKKLTIKCYWNQK